MEMAPPALLWLFVALTGLCFGSFVTLASHRLPLDQSTIRPPSHCPACRTRLTSRDLVPVFSWLFCRGRCAHCRARVHWRYPAIELAQAALFLLVYCWCGWTVQTMLLCLLSVCLLILIVTDLEHMIIPDEVQIAGGALALIYAASGHSAWSDLWLGSALGWGIGLALHYGFRWIRKKEGLGFGDVKFLGVAGAWLGWMPMVPFLFFAGLFGVLSAVIWRVAGQGERYPFGPSLAIALFVCLLFPEIPAVFWSLGGH